ncbi:MAG: hypothetical protein N3D11_12250 [Candidatus Sumerlaeia bacterium]|nr:hypothetical protein [Candidatus Sumerlaeia bacterium]
MNKPRCTSVKAIKILIICVLWGAALSCVRTTASAAPPRDAFPQFSGIYPHLAVTNGGQTESGIGAVVPWAGKLWYLTYPAHMPRGSDDKLYELDPGLNVTVRPESVGGTHANRMIHRESNQLIMGYYFIDAKGNVRAIRPADMPGRMTATTRHLTDPTNKVYFFTMEEGLYEVDVHTLAIKVLHPDSVAGGKDLLPGNHGKGAYVGQGRLVVANNGRGGCLAEWTGRGDPSDAKSWTVIDRNKYCDVTGPEGVAQIGTLPTAAGYQPAPHPAASTLPLWAIGWDHKSVLLNVCDGGHWTRFRLPKSSYTYDADHGYYTEWPRIREVGGSLMLMNMHGMFFDFPKTFRPANCAGLRPISTHHKIVVDFAAWNDGVVMACDDASKMSNPLLGRPQSNLWFTTAAQLRELGAPAGWGGVWLGERVKAGEASEPYLLAGFEKRIVHLSHNSAASVAFIVEIDAKGDGQWSKYTEIAVPAKGYVWHVIPKSVRAEWIRVRAASHATSASAYFHYASPSQGKYSDSPFSSLARADKPARLSEGLLRPQADTEMTLQFAADVVDETGKITERGYYVIGQNLRLQRVEDRTAEQTLRTTATIKQDFEVDAASVIMKDAKGRRYRLPKGVEAFTALAAERPRRGIREVATERHLMNIHGTFYERPWEASGGLAKIRPLCTHNRLIHDFCSWRGMLVMSGNLLQAKSDGHYVASDDGKTGLWFGNVDDLWKLGKPRGQGGPWRDTPVRAGQPSDPYLMTGYDRKSLQMSHDAPRDVQFTIEVDFAADGSWHTYATVAVPPGKTSTHNFPDGYSAHWVRVRTDTDCKATAWLVYE